MKDTELLPGVNKILIVEDSKTQLLRLQNVLENNGFHVATASNGHEALRLLKESLPDIILSDIIMPEMNGYDLCKIIKDEPQWNHIPIILLTALSDPEDVIIGLNAGADNFIPKPFTDDFLMSKINYLLTNRKMRSESLSSAGVDVFFSGKRHTITSDKIQIIDLLLSTYESAVTNNSELQRMNLQLSQLKDDLEENNKKLAKANEEKNHFVGMAAHDIRNPLGGIFNFADLLLDDLGDQLSEDHLKFMNIIKSSADLLLNMVTELLDISKIEAGELTLKKQTSDLISFINDNIEKNKYLADRKKITITFKSKINNINVEFDPFRLEQVLNNLISNAIKYSGSGTTISVLAEIKNKEIIFSIKDQGVGLPEKEFDKLFKPFSKTSAQTTAGESSTGLGLFTCKKIIEAHKGNIYAESIVGNGSTFYFTLPINNFEDAELDKKIISLDAGLISSGRILLVDDNEMNYKFFKGALKNLVQDFDWADNGETAIKMCQKTAYDMILMDIHMPNMNGLDVTRHIRTFNNKVTIIGQTAYVMDGMKEKCLEAGCNNYIAMPILPNQVVEIIRKYLS